ncbi:MAG: GTP pyrophosphokinase family protein [Lachnospiraceae bacterium]|nr:GTP pyrophosphokinase family protein [Lachnospiraceae bacterium]
MDRDLIATGDEVRDWETLMLLYNSALKEINTKIEILRDEFENTNHYNPIEHVTSRLKTAQSIVRKLKNEGHETDLVSMQRYISDIAGVRIVCSFTSDIYKIADMISSQDDVNVLVIKNYIASPKPNGYKSYHMIVSIPIFLSDGPRNVKVEIQIRTIAMDFWATLEHKIHYKFEGNTPKVITDELTEVAAMINTIDERMQALNDTVKSFNATT